MGLNFKNVFDLKGVEFEKRRMILSGGGIAVLRERLLPAGEAYHESIRSRLRLHARLINYELNVIVSRKSKTPW